VLFVSAFSIPSNVDTYPRNYNRHPKNLLAQEFSHKP